MKRTPLLLGFCLCGVLLSGCQAPTLEEARAACEAKGGQLVIIYSQRITLAGPEPAKASPGDCFLPEPKAPAPAKAGG